MSNSIRIHSLHEGQTHVTCGGAGEPGNWNATITPAAEDGLAVLREVFRDGWREHVEPHTLQAWDEINRVVHVAFTVRRDGYVVDIARTSNPADLPGDFDALDIAEDVQGALDRHRGDI